MYCTESDVKTARTIAILQSTVVFLSIALFLAVGFIYVYVGTH